MIKAVIFDLDNTLVDFIRMKKVAVDLAADYMINAGLSGKKEQVIKQLFKIYWKTHIESQSALEELIKQRTGKLDYRILASGIIGYQRGRDMATYPYPGVETTIKELLKMGLKLATISDAPAEQCYNRLARLHLINWFDVIITFNDTGEKKPSPKPFLLALEKLKVKPGEAFYVGDWPERDIVGSKKVGMVTAFARWGEHPGVKGVKATGADYDLKSVNQIVKIVKRINQPA